jgi:hypothetical protein
MYVTLQLALASGEHEKPANFQANPSPLKTIAAHCNYLPWGRTTNRAIF